MCSPWLLSLPAVNGGAVHFQPRPRHEARTPSKRYHAEPPARSAEVFPIRRMRARRVAMGRAITTLDLVLFSSNGKIPDRHAGA